MNSNATIFFIVLLAMSLALSVFYFYQLQKKLRLLTEELNKEKKSAALGELCGGFVHEINNPLAVISARVQILQSQFEADKFDKAQITKSIGTIASMADRIVKILKSIKLFVKDSSAELFETTSLNEIILETILLIEMRSAKFSVQVRKVGFELDFIIECQPTQTFQKLWDAMSSCFDAVSAQSEKWIQFELLDEGASVCLKITDSSLSTVKVILFPK